MPSVEDAHGNQKEPNSHSISHSFPYPIRYIVHCSILLRNSHLRVKPPGVRFPLQRRCAAREGAPVAVVHAVRWDRSAGEGGLGGEPLQTARPLSAPCEICLCGLHLCAPRCRRHLGKELGARHLPGQRAIINCKACVVSQRESTAATAVSCPRGHPGRGLIQQSRSQRCLR